MTGATGDAGEVTRLLAAWSDDGPERERLAELVYPHLKRIARRRMRSDSSLQVTEVVHEAWMRLCDQRSTDWRNRGHFYCVCARLVRRLLVDRARARGRSKRGGDRERTTLRGLPADPGTDLDLALDLDRALGELEEIDPEAVRVVELRYFAGLGQEETAEALGLGRATVARRWAAARTWLWARLREDGRAAHGDDQASREPDSKPSPKTEEGPAKTFRASSS